MECVILFRNTQNDVVGFVAKPDADGENSGNIEVFTDIEDAIRATETVPILRAFPYQIVQLDEL